MSKPTTSFRVRRLNSFLFCISVKKLTTLVDAIVEDGDPILRDFSLLLFERIKVCHWILILKNERVLGISVNLGV